MRSYSNLEIVAESLSLEVSCAAIHHVLRRLDINMSSKMEEGE